MILAASSGTVFSAPNYGGYEITDVTDGQSAGCLATSVTNNGATVAITFGPSVRAGDQVAVAANGVGGPAISSLEVSTTSDPVPVVASG